MSKQPISTAKINFQANGTPVSEKFNDIYFDAKTTYSQSEQVFINGNNIAKRWQQLAEKTDDINRTVTGGTKTFVIAETGFGTGLNFLLTLKMFIAFKQQTQSNITLEFISCEKYPLTKVDLQRALALWPQLTSLSDELLAQYDYKNNHCQMAFANGNVTLKVYFSDAAIAYSATNFPCGGLVDAWYLDGFAPQKNPSMWTPKLFAHVARLAKPRSTLATFTVAKLVRQGLQRVGFKIQKQKSKQVNECDRVNETASLAAIELNASTLKNETLSAVYLGIRQGEKLNGFKRRNTDKTERPRHVTIIGGGLASACSALALAKKGIQVNLYCKDKGLADGASSNAVGAIYPLIHQQQDTISLFYQQGFEHALKLYQQLLNDGYEFSHGFDGLVEVAYKEALAKRVEFFNQNSPWPESLIHGVSAEDVDNIANISVGHPGLYMPKAGWVCPPELVKAMIQAAVDTGFCKIKTNRHISNIKQLDNGHWLLNTNKGQKTAKHLVVCAGADSLNIDVLNNLPLTQVRGQVSQMQSNEKVQGLKAVLCHKGYLTPQSKGFHCIGATFDKDDSDTESRAEDDKYNLTMLERCLGDIANWDSKDVKGSKARLRCCTPDHMPIVGQLPNLDLHREYYQHLSKDKNWHFEQAPPIYPGLFVLTGLGARGLCTAPLLAEILVSELCDEVYPVDDEMLFNLAPNRFVIRDLIKRK